MKSVTYIYSFLRYQRITFSNLTERKVCKDLLHVYLLHVQILRKSWINRSSGYDQENAGNYTVRLL